MTSRSLQSNTNTRPRETDWGLIRRLASYASNYKGLIGLCILLLVPVAVSRSVQPLLIGQAISLIKGEEVYHFIEGMSRAAGLRLLAFLLFLTITLGFAVQAVQGYLVQKMGQKMTADIRNDIFDHVLSLAVRFFDRSPVGKLITRLTSDVEALGEVFSTGAIGIVSDLFSLVVIAATMLFLQWQLGLMLLLTMIPIAGVIIYYQQQYRKANYKAREELSNLNGQLQENLVGINVVQLFLREELNSKMFGVTNRRYVKSIDKTIFYDSAVSATLEWISLIAIAAVLLIGGNFVIGDQLTFGTLSSFILYAQLFFEPLRQFADKFTAVQAGLTAVERVSDILNQPIEIRDPEGKNRRSTDSFSNLPESHLGEIIFDNVSFAYKPDEYVIKNLNFTIKPGEKVALVGPTGAGKTSLIRLLCRLYEINQGKIIVDGIEVRDLPQAELRRHIGVILQDSFLFSGDVKTNISLGESYSINEIRNAAERTNVAKFIEQLPEGYDTQLRERGTNLSGGQKQLLAFARVAIRNPKILVLDEATASLDVGTEALIQEALDRLLAGRTAIIIAHRLSTIKNVDRILVLKRGEIVESGSHDELLRQDGTYASLYKLQMLGS
ncbi:MAG: ABC transporter ATP-binding protein [Cyanobacteriota bacterium]|nr:ABC transporter ATP-binding protein [Cyanobacteriota bacterium]